ncbi:copper resistance CopC family protein [Kocuria flava]|uniref:copper resistance CopC family protein n=1 Tax=Kocuria flava TaxID=446860 RepID=UPI002F95F6A3
MPSTDPRIPLPRTTAALVLATALGGLSATPVAAHEELTGSTPENGAVLETAPEEIQLNFSGEPMDLGSQVQVTDSTGTPVTDGDLEINGTQVLQPLAGTGTEDETYQVVWRVVSSDGHPLEGTFTYQVGDGADPITPTEAPSPAADDAPADTTDPMPLWAVGLTAAVLVAAAAAAALIRRRRSS